VVIGRNRIFQILIRGFGFFNLQKGDKYTWRQIKLSRASSDHPAPSAYAKFVRAEAAMTKTAPAVLKAREARADSFATSFHPASVIRAIAGEIATR
jgi:hypothetical protein